MLCVVASFGAQRPQEAFQRWSIGPNLLNISLTITQFLQKPLVQLITELAYLEQVWLLYICVATEVNQLASKFRLKVPYPVFFVRFTRTAKIVNTVTIVCAPFKNVPHQ